MGEGGDKVEVPLITVCNRQLWVGASTLLGVVSLQLKGVEGWLPQPFPQFEVHFNVTSTVKLVVRRRLFVTSADFGELPILCFALRSLPRGAPNQT